LFLPLPNEKDISRHTIVEHFTNRLQRDVNLGSVLQLGKDHANLFRDYVSKRIVISCLKPKQDETVLDFGCGVGRLSRHLAKRCKRVEAVDATPAMIETACANFENPSNITYRVLESTVLPFASDSLDAAFTFWVLQHCGDDTLKRVLREIHRVLKPGGRFVLMEQTANKRMVYEGWNIHRTVEEYKRFGQDAALEVLSEKHVMRNPSRGMAIWIKLKRDWKPLLPLLYRLDRAVLHRKIENVEYFTTAVEFVKR